MMMDNDPPAPAVRPRTPVPLGERIQFALVGVVVGGLLGCAAMVALAPLVGRQVGEGLGTGMFVGIVFCFGEGYPRRGWRFALAFIACCMGGFTLVHWPWR